ncbi:MAG: glycosyltransferase family 4 protein [Verrucomicrobia bacterium]|nr:glycosyltransferase family 4 protein [Verrucomicrobiota bacterium]
MTTPDLTMPGGVAIFCQSIQSALGPDVDYLTIGRRTGESGSMSTTLQRLRRDAAAVRAATASGRYDVLHVNPSLTPKAMIRDGNHIRLATRNQTHAVAFFHGWDPKVQRLVQRFGRLFMRATFYKSRALIVLASEFREQLRQMHCPTPVHLMATVVPDDVMAQAATAVDQRFAAHQHGVFRLLFLSRIEPEKGIFETLDAFAILQKTHPNMELVVAGSGSALDAARQRVAERGLQRVNFTGYITGEDKHRAFREADVFLFPTAHGEGMPISLLEAMAYGLPIITCPVGGIRDFFVDHKMGTLIQDRLPETIAAAVAAWLSDPERLQTTGRYNHGYCREHFASSCLAAQLWDLYRLMTIKDNSHAA